MCGRITQKSPLAKLGLHVVLAADPVNATPRFNGVPGQEHWVLRQNPKTREHTLHRLFWGLIPHWCEEPNGGRRPINAKSETVASLPYLPRCLSTTKMSRSRGFLLRVEGNQGSKAETSLRHWEEDRGAFALAGLWENWRHPQTEEWIRTFAIITCPANDLIRQIHDRMPVIIAPIQYDRWLSPNGTLAIRMGGDPNK